MKDLVISFPGMGAHMQGMFLKYNPPKFNSSPLKIDGWKMTFPVWNAYFQVLWPMLVLGSV